MRWRMSHDTWNYQDALRREGYRVTPQRERIMDLVCQAGMRLSAQQICEAARSGSPAMNDATVYRNLRFLTDRKLLRAIEQDGRTCYVLGGPAASHHHLICRRCGDEIEIPDDATRELYERLERRYGFRVDDDHLVLHGRCRACLTAS